MSSTFFKDLYKESEEGVQRATVPAQTADVVVTRANPLSTSNLIFLTLGVLDGPSKGKESEVSLYFPGEGSKRGARIYFHKKVAGFIGYPDVKAAFQSADNAPSEEAAFQVIAEALVGKKVTADIGLVTEGEYAGTNELRSTKTIGSALGEQPTASPVGAQIAQSPAEAVAGTVVPF